MRRLALATLLAASLASCSRRAAGGRDAGPAPVETPPALSLTRDRTDLLFTWIDLEGKLHDVDSADKVPADRRRQVLVRDLSKKPEELAADRFVYVADLTREEGGAWPYAVVSRYASERSVKSGDFGADLAAAGDGGEARVTLYGTSWCGACAQARQWLRSHQIPFADRDVEADRGAQVEMARKAREAGLQVGGVPVIDVGGKLMLGFDPSRLEQMLRSGQ
jgi:glutaredoxin